MKVKIGLGKAGKRLGSSACLTLGRRISNIECGLAYAARSIQTGNAAGLVQGLEVASRFSREVEVLLPAEAGAARSIKTGAESIDQELRKKKKVSGVEAGKVLDRIRALAKKAEGLHASAAQHCGGKK